ncbi:hypothetical protein BGX27_007953 [Mortierella sp. AM989]|nr:hypothetical protein BGX27_007953 [Mortierella sp. AM989]
MSDLEIIEHQQQHRQADSTIKDQDRIDYSDQNDFNLGQGLEEDKLYGDQESQSSQVLQGGSFRQSWVSSSFSTNSSPLLSNRSLSNRHSHQPSSSSDLHSILSSATPSSSTNYRTNINRRQSRGTDGVYARPNSIVSIYGADLARNESVPAKRSQKGKEGNQSQKVPATLNTQNKEESNDAFDRICSLLTHLIVDASTAVGGEVDEADGAATSLTGMIARGATRVGPTIVPLLYSDSESSDTDEGKVEEESNDTQEILQDSIDLDRDDRTWDRSVFRSRSRMFNERNVTKRRSLFMELQSCQPQEFLDDNIESQDGMVENLDLNQEESIPTELEALPDIARPWTSEDAKEFIADPTSSFEALSSLDGLLHPPVVKSLRRCASFPSMKSEMIEMQHAGSLQQVIQHMDSELDRTVETIDGLTRDLVAIATHQNWMQMNFEKSSQFQTLQYGRGGKVHNPRKASSEYFKHLSQDSDASPTSPTFPTYQSDFIRHYWDAHQSSLWEKDDELVNSASTTPSDNPLRMYIRPNAPKSSVSTDDTVADSDFGPGSPTLSEGLISNRSFSNYFESLQTGDETQMRKLDLEHADGEDEDDVLDPLSEYRGNAFHQDSTINSQRSSGSSFTLADSSCRTSALSLDGTLITPLDTCPGYKDGRTTYSPPPRFSETDYPFQAEKFLQIQASVESTRARVRRSIMPAAWPMTALSPDRDTEISSLEDQQQERFLVPADNQLPQEDETVVLSLVNAHIHVALLVFWTSTFVIATIVMNTSLVQMSSSRVRVYMESVQRLVSIDSIQSEDDREESDAIEEMIKLLDKSENAISRESFDHSKHDFAWTAKRDLSHSRTLSGSGSVAGSKNRRKLLHQRRQRDWIMGSTGSSSSSNLSLYRGSPILRTMKFCPTAYISEAEPKGEGISGEESLTILVDLED